MGLLNGPGYNPAWTTALRDLHTGSWPGPVSSPTHPPTDQQSNQPTHAVHRLATTACAPVEVGMPRRYRALSAVAAASAITRAPSALGWIPSRLMYGPYGWAVVMIATALNAGLVTTPSYSAPSGKYAKPPVCASFWMTAFIAASCAFTATTSAASRM